MFTVYGFGNTTNEAYEDAYRVFKERTAGDPRDWIVEGESYRLELTEHRKPVVCELTLTLLETVA